MWNTCAAVTLGSVLSPVRVKLSTLPDTSTHQASPEVVRLHHLPSYLDATVIMV